MATRAWDILDRRILAALRFVDGLGRPVRGPVAIEATAGVRWFVKPDGMVILTDAPGLEAHAEAFAAPPATPAFGSIPIVLDLKPADSGHAPRRVTIDLPRNASEAVDIRLLPSPAARGDGLTAGVRVSVTRGDDGRVIENALVRLRPDGLGEFMALTDAGGEALLLADGVPLTTPGPGAVMLGDIAAVVDAVIVPAVARFNAPADIFAARRVAQARTRDFADPDTIVGPSTPDQPLRIAAGRIRTAQIAWTPP